MTQKKKKEKSEFTDNGCEPGSVSNWVRSVNDDGNQEAFGKLVTRYIEKLEKAAAAKIRKYNVPTGAVVAEDVAQSVLFKFWKGVTAGEFRDVRNRNGLWGLLRDMIEKKVIDKIRYEMAARRSTGQPNKSLTENDGKAICDELVENKPSAEDLTEMEEEISRLLAMLGDEKQRQIAVLFIDGYSNKEIRQRLGISSATVNRKLIVIREEWKKALDAQRSNDGKR